MIFRIQISLEGIFFNSWMSFHPDLKMYSPNVLNSFLELCLFGWFVVDGKKQQLLKILLNIISDLFRCFIRNEKTCWIIYNLSISLEKNVEKNSIDTYSFKGRARSVVEHSIGTMFFSTDVNGFQPNDLLHEKLTL